MQSDPNHRKVSEILRDLTASATGERVSLRDMVQALGDRAFGLLILIFALPNAVGLGTIPGVSTIFGLPQIFVALQMALGLARPWLPSWLLDRSIARADFTTMVEKSMPHILRVERLLRPRWMLVSTPPAERLLGLLFALLATIVSLPIPFGNQPPAAAMAVISIGLVVRDGLCVLLGLVIAAFAVALAAAVIAGGAAIVFVILHHVFG